MKGLLYPVGSTRPRVVLLPAPSFPDDDDSVRAQPEDVDVAHWFAGSTRYITISSIPGTGFLLTNKYTVISNALQPSGPPNRSLRDTLGIHVRGNVIVLRHAVSRPDTVTNIHPAEKRFVDLIILRYAQLQHTPHRASAESTYSRYRFQLETDLKFGPTNDAP